MTRSIVFRVLCTKWHTWQWPFLIEHVQYTLHVLTLWFELVGLCNVGYMELSWLSTQETKEVFLKLLIGHTLSLV